MGSIGSVSLNLAIIIAIVSIAIGYILGNRFRYINRLSSMDNEHYQKVVKKGRKQLEAVISERVTFLQNDLMAGVSSINSHIKQKLSQSLQNEMKQYSTSLAEMRKVTENIVKQSQYKTEQQYEELKDQLAKSLMDEKQRIVQQLEENITDIVSYYIQTAVGKNLELHEQIPFIIANLQAEKASIIEDVKNGI